MTVKAIVVGAAVAVVAAAGTIYAVGSAPTYTTVSVPASYGGHTIAADCTSDATAGLNAFFGSLPANTIVDFATNGCYSVSPNAADILDVTAANNLIINGNGSTLSQPSYLESDGTTNGCNNGIIAPVLRLWSDTTVTVNNMVVEGPTTNSTYNCPGSLSEGDAGIYIGNHSANDGSTNVTFEHVTVENVNGDALDIYPDLSTNDTGINTNVVFQDGTLTNWGWYGIVPEGVNGLNVTGSTIGNSNGRFLDAENDGSCDGVGGPTYAQCTSGPGGTPVGAAMWNMSIVNNTFTSSAGIDGEGPQGCIPQHNWTIAGNSAPDGLGVLLDGSNGNTACPAASTGLTIANNTGAGGYSECGGSPATPPLNCAGLGVDAWADVNVTNNALPSTTGGAGSLRTVTDGVTTSGSTTITSATANFTSADACSLCYVTGTGIPANTYLASVTNATTAVLSAAATANGTSVTLGIGHDGNYPNTPVMEAVSLCSVTGGQVANNNFDGAYGLWDTVHCKDTGNSTIPTTGVTDCGNNWGLGNPYAYYTYSAGVYTLHSAPSANPQTDIAC